MAAVAAQALRRAWAAPCRGNSSAPCVALQQQRGGMRQPRRVHDFGAAERATPLLLRAASRDSITDLSSSSESEPLLPLSVAVLPTLETLPGHFDLDTAILLAGFAFESYLSPEGGLLDTDVRGGSTSYLSPFVREVFAGIVQVTVLRCEKLAKADLIGLSDPYCVLSTGGGSSYRTTTKRVTLNPKWSEDEATARLYVRRDLTEQVLTIRVLDEDIFESDDMLGVVFVPLKDIIARAQSPMGQMFAQSEEMTLDLPSGSGAPGGGTVTFTLQYLPFNPPAVQMITEGLKAAAMEIDRNAQSEDLDPRLQMAVKAAGAAAGAMAGGLASFSKESAQREFESALWAVQTDGDWAVLASQKGLQVRGREAKPHSYEKVCFVENSKTDTQAAVWRCAPDKTIVVSFRGTEMTKVRDVITDANLTPAPFNPERVTGGEQEVDYEGVGSAVEGVDAEEDVRVHGGFLSAYDSVRGRVFAAVDDIMAASAPASGGSLNEKQTELTGGNGIGTEDAEASTWHIFVTGHSLGGALATLFSAELGESIKASRRDCTVTMYNYGSPRVGNRPFVALYNRLVPDSIRVINGTDLVPTLPAFLGYRHVDHGVRIPSDGSKVLCGASDVRPAAPSAANGGQKLVNAGDKSASSEGSGGGNSTAAKIMELAETLGVVTVLGVDEETAADAAAALASLVSSAALQDHFEDKYYLALKDVSEFLTPTSTLTPKA